MCLKGMLVGLSAVRAVLEPYMRAFGKASHCMDATVNGQQLRIVGKLSVIVIEYFGGLAAPDWNCCT